MPRGSICRAKGCTSNKYSNPKLTFHAFPKHKERFQQWCELLQRPDLKHSFALCHHRMSMRVCSLHFEDSMYVSGTSTSRLMWNALPIPVKEPSSPSTIEELAEENDNKTTAARNIKKLSADSKVSDYTLLSFKPPKSKSSSCVEMNCKDDVIKKENDNCLEGNNGGVSLQKTHQGEKTSPLACLEGGNGENILPGTHDGDKTSPLKCLEGGNGGNSLPNPLTGDKREKDCGPIRRHTVKTKDGKLRTFMIINKTSLQTLQEKGLLQPLSKSGNQTISSVQCKKIMDIFQQPSKPPEMLAVSSDSSISSSPSVSSMSPTPFVSTIQTHTATNQTILPTCQTIQAKNNTNQTSSPTNQVVKGATNQTSPNTNQIVKVVSGSFTNQTSPNASQIILTTNQTNQVPENTSQTTLATNQTKDATQTQTGANQFIINTNLATLDTLDSILAINDTLKATNQNNSTPNIISNIAPNISPKPIRVTINSPSNNSQDISQDISENNIQDISENNLQDNSQDNSENNIQDKSQNALQDSSLTTFSAVKSDINCSENIIQNVERAKNVRIQNGQCGKKILIQNVKCGKTIMTQDGQRQKNMISQNVEYGRKRTTQNTKRAQKMTLDIKRAQKTNQDIKCAQKTNQDVECVKDIITHNVQQQPKQKRTQNVRWVALPISPVQNSDPAVPTIIKTARESTTTQIDSNVGKLLSPQRHKGGQKDSQSSSCRELKKRYLRLLNKHRRRYHLLLKKYKTMQTKVLESELEKNVKGSPQQVIKDASKYLSHEHRLFFESQMFLRNKSGGMGNESRGMGNRSVGTENERNETENESIGMENNNGGVTENKSGGAGNGNRFSPQLMELMISYYRRSPAGYRFLRTIFTIPSITTVHKWMYRPLCKNGGVMEKDHPTLYTRNSGDDDLDCNSKQGRSPLLKTRDNDDIDCRREKGHTENNGLNQPISMRDSGDLDCDSMHCNEKQSHSETDDLYCKRKKGHTETDDLYCKRKKSHCELVNTDELEYMEMDTESLDVVNEKSEAEYLSEDIVEEEEELLEGERSEEEILEVVRSRKGCAENS